MAVLKLGLIGDNIARSQSPRLHREAGRLCGLHVSYERLIPRDVGLDFFTVFDKCASEGFHGINVTYPYKEQVVSRLVVTDPLAASIRACNTVLFNGAQPEGYNTDYSGFAAAFRATFGGMSPGAVAMAGAGGVGKAIAFALVGLGASKLRIFDTDTDKSEGLAAALRGADMSVDVAAAPSIAAATDAVDGLVNCTPLGMSGLAGTAMKAEHMLGATWAFDAVYTPADTEFLRLAAVAGATVMSGYELFFHQGVDAFRHFSGIEVDAAALRAALNEDRLETQQP